MGARGAITQPDNVRQLRGNPGKRKPQPRPKAVPAIPAMPSWLDPEARAEWKRVTPELMRLGILAQIDRGVLALACDAWSRWVDARKEMAKSVVVKGEKQAAVKNPAWQIYRDAANLYASLCKELGTSPNARLRMTLPESNEDDESDLDS